MMQSASAGPDGRVVQGDRVRQAAGGWQGAGARGKMGKPAAAVANK